MLKKVQPQVSFIINLDTAQSPALTASILSMIGGKGANLMELVRAGLGSFVPPGFIITTEAYKHFLRANHIEEQVYELADISDSENRLGLDTATAAITELFEHSTIPDELIADIIEAYQRLTGFIIPGAVAVRSSATTEDLPGASFAGQQATLLNISGAPALLAAIKRCWASLWSARALSYRLHYNIAARSSAIAVIVQVLVPSQISGVIFTANPLTGKRDELVLNASFGLGESIVAGLVEPDLYTINKKDGRITGRKPGHKATAIIPQPEGGTRQVEINQGQNPALSDEQIFALARLARRVEEHYHAPQDVEWAWYGDRFHLLQTRPITSLYPLPSPALSAATLRCYISFNTLQNIIEPFTPAGWSLWQDILAGLLQILRVHHIHASHIFPVAGSRLFIDVTSLVADPRLQSIILTILERTDPCARQTLLRLIKERRIPVQKTLRAGFGLRLLFSALPLLLRTITGWRNPEKLRITAQHRAEAIVSHIKTEIELAPGFKEKISILKRLTPRFLKISGVFVPLLVPSMLLLPVAERLLKRWLDEPAGTLLRLMRGIAGNVTTEMNLKLWTVARAISSDREAKALFVTKSATELAHDSQFQSWPPTAKQAFTAFLQEYGMRGTGEIDLGRKRWREDPLSLIQIIQGYLRLNDPALAPDTLFFKRKAEAEELAAELTARIRHTNLGRIKSWVWQVLSKRLRLLGPVRELPLFYLVKAIDIYRTVLLDGARELVTQGHLEKDEDIFFIPLDKLSTWLEQKTSTALNFQSGTQPAHWQPIISQTRTAYEQELRRQLVPCVLLSTGEAFYGSAVTARDQPEAISDKHELVGQSVSPGIAEGPARIVFDPQEASLQPGEILVCAATDPSWTPLFLTAGGLVTEIGGLVTHGSIVAREYGLPAIVGVTQATTRIKTGQRIRIDGNTGHITLFSR